MSVCEDYYGTFNHLRLAMLLKHFIHSNCSSLEQELRERVWSEKGKSVRALGG